MPPSKETARLAGFLYLLVAISGPFVLLYVPCMVTVVIIGRESGSWKWALFAVGYTTALAYVMSFIVYNGGRLLGLGS